MRSQGEAQNHRRASKSHVWAQRQIPQGNQGENCVPAVALRGCKERGIGGNEEKREAPYDQRERAQIAVATRIILLLECM